jgi:hypothetical protein
MSAYEGEHTIFGLLDQANLTQNDVLQFHPFTQISRIRNAKGEITTNTMEVQEIIRDYFENLKTKHLKAAIKLE